MGKNLILKAFTNDKYSLTETEEAVEVPFVVLRASSTMTPEVNGEPATTVFTLEAVNKIKDSIVGKPVLQDHYESVSNIVGVVSSAKVEEDTLIATVKIPKTEEKLISLIKLKPSPINQVSVGGYIKSYEETENGLLITDFEVKELSLVIQGASPDTKRLDAKNSNKKEEKQMDELKKLQEENAKLKAQLDELQKKLEAKEQELNQLKLSAYKAEKLAEIPQHLQALAKPAIEVATTKEAVDKLVEEYKKLQATQVPTFNTPAPETNQNQNPFVII